ncbi:MAG: low molecular weight phosphotyrosine protein phosphatase [Ruminococcus sp.]|nr:low molecular weight phosphotyrosine protein phosphatase [Ruminococcus sp.]MCM1380734.1 low molecular weight phosphotyrosine protein phosphatase [Muribaculaceae bacterium]MCM1479152.1 low molecular weight phosphotyrosine protein phosphatase [Muribaculaceae bacterium]
MYKIMFVCHGNICRSPMAEFIMKKLVRDEGLSENFFIASAATSTEEIGNPVYPPARRELARHGLSPEGKFAVQLKKSDYEKYDLFAVMDENNLRNIRRIFPSDPQGKVRKLLSFAGSGRDVADPWYSGDFETAYNDIFNGCTALLAELKEEIL